jgi:beta-glucosidase
MDICAEIPGILVETSLAELFPETFVWGAATAAYQIEGAASADGRGESIWDRFSATPGKVRNGETGAIACDFYNRYPDDVKLMSQLGIDAFRLSISWPRVLPGGRGPVNDAGLDFYDRLIDELLEADITPFVTLYHWDLPQALEDAGGWPSRPTVDAFVEYADVVTRRLGDRVKDWMTHNEPWVAASHGYGSGVHAPGRSSRAEALAAAHHLLLSHGYAVDVIRRNSPGAQVGIALSMCPVYPGGETDEDLAATRFVDGLGNRWFLDPLYRRGYPEDVAELLGSDVPDIQDGDLAVIGAPTDFLGINNYFREVVVEGAASDQPRVIRDPAWETTDMGWEVYPDGLFDLLVRVGNDYAPPSIHITENGAAFSDIRSHDGAVRDPERTAFLQDYIGAVGRAIDAGVRVDGYFAWSFLDNFEWACGYAKRFGLVHVDFHSLERTPKQSFYWYRDLIERHRSFR